MNSIELLKDNKKSLSNIYKSFFDHLKKMADEKKFEITSKEPVIEAKNGPSEVSNLALLRFGTAKNSCVYTIGYSRPDSLKIWTELFAPANPTAPNAKTTEFELTKVLFQQLDAEFKSQGTPIDPKTAMIQDGLSLGGWNKISVEQSILFPIGTPQGDLVLEIPLFDTAYASQLTFQLYGFKENARIMVVDDSLVSRKTSRTYLAMAGYFNVEETADGQQAYTKVFGSRPAFDLVVADWHMPVMSGFELLKKLRSVEDFKKLPIILVTGEKNKDEVVAAIKEGVNSYLVKPVAPDAFLKALKKASGQP